jgi:hypothetical protein
MPGVIQTKIEYLPEPLQQEVLDDIDFLCISIINRDSLSGNPRTCFAVRNVFSVLTQYGIGCL